MKTFEERYTAWIDGQLEGSVLAAFERELARRAEAGDAESAEADRDGALQLRSLLKEHLQAPALTNSEFFSHQMRERIDAEISRAAARREANARPAFRFPKLVWPFARFAGAGVLCLFVAGALYYGMVPSQRQTSPVAVSPVERPQQQTSPEQVAVNDSPAPVQVASASQIPGNLLVKRDPTPAPPTIDDNSAPAVTLGNGTQATSLQVGKDSVIWLNSPSTLTDTAGVTPSPAPAPSAVPAAAPTAAPAPSATP